MKKWENMGYNIDSSTFFQLLNGEVGCKEEKVADMVETFSAKPPEEWNFISFSKAITQLCEVAEKPIVILIDEVDQAGNYDSFIKFLGLLRSKYLERDEKKTFQSVVLAGVYDVKNIKLKIRPEETHQYNSPWNIAADFDVIMDFNSNDIAGMLCEYREDHHLEFDVSLISDLIFQYTSGYPFLVSKICKVIDEKVLKLKKNGEENTWDREDVLKAVNIILNESNTLFDDMDKKMEQFPKLRKMFYHILYEGKSYPYVISDRHVELAVLFGFIKNKNGMIQIANRIFETRLYNQFVFEETDRNEM